MKVVPLGPADAARIEALALQHHGEARSLALEEIEESLNIAEEEEGNYSFGLEGEGNELLGYLTAWLEESRLEGRKESVVLIDDLVVDEEARSGVKDLIRAMIAEMANRGQESLAIEAAVVSSARHVFAQPRKFFESLGYELVAQSEYEDEELGENLTWIRIEPWEKAPPKMSERRRLSPWLWVPSLYFAESIPNAVVADTAKFMYKGFGLSATDIGLVTGSMYLAWVVKPMWSPFVDLVKSKRWWIVFTELILAVSFLGLAASAASPNWLFWTRICLWMIAFTSATQDISADGFYMLGLNQTQQAAYTGVRSTAYRLAMLCAKGALPLMAGSLTKEMGIFQGWSTVMSVPGVVFLCLALYHFLMLPRPANDVAVPVDRSEFLKGYAHTFSSFFAKPGILRAIPFMLLFRLAEVQVGAMIGPFLMGKVEAGGLGYGIEEVGVAYGTFGVLGIICGGVLGGVLVARSGLRAWFWVLICVMHIPNLAFLYLAFSQNNAVLVVSSCLFIEQFGYGFGLTAYMLYLMYLARGPQQTSHYALATGFMAMSQMFPTMACGRVCDSLGFKGYYVYIACCTIPSFIVSVIAWTDKPFLDYFEPKRDDVPL